MRTSKRGVDLIRSFEGLSLQAVKLPGEEHYTIGYGHYGAETKKGMTVTLQEAEDLLKEDLCKFENWVNTYVPFELNQNQFDALVSFTYNLGPGNLKQLVENRTAEEAASHFLAYTNSTSEDYREGLKRRRQVELALYLESWKEELDMTKEELLSVEGTGDKPSSWAVEATEWAKRRGLFAGDGKGNYGWQQPISREAVAAILWALAEVLNLK